MGGESNLRVPTSEEARRNGAKGGIASGKARREKADLRKAIQILLEETRKMGDKEISGAEAIAVAQFKKALKGDPKAFELIRDTAGQKPVEKVEQVNIDAQYTEKLEMLKRFFDGADTKSDKE